MNTESPWGGTRGRSGRRRGTRTGAAKGAPKPGDVVLSGGAVLSVLTGGPGSKKIEARLAAPGTAVIETVSLFEILCALSERGLSDDEVHEVLDALALGVEDVDEELAHAAGAVAKSASQGLSLADCCCVALGRRLELPVLVTGEWPDALENVEVVAR